MALKNILDKWDKSWYDGIKLDESNLSSSHQTKTFFQCVRGRMIFTQMVKLL